MRYKDSVKEKVRKLRIEGLGLNQISKTANVPKSTIRLWILDIRLTEEQKIKLNNRVIQALQKGRIKAQKINKSKRIERENLLLMGGNREIGQLTKKELFIAGIALYWAEGFKNKHEKRLGFCNSDPKMILFYLKWLKEALGVEVKNITARVSLNASYRDKESEIKKIIGLNLRIFHQSNSQQASIKIPNGINNIRIKNIMEYFGFT